MGGDDEPPALRVRGELVTEVPEEARHAGMLAERFAPAEDEPAMRRPWLDAKRRSIHDDGEAALIALDRAGHLPEGKRARKNVSEHPTRFYGLGMA